MRMPTVQPIDLDTLLKSIPLGAWVAISPDWQRVLAVGFDVDTVVGEAKAQGELHPVVMRVPEASAALVLWVGTIYKLPYTGFPIPPSAVFPKGSTAYRPVVPIQIHVTATGASVGTLAICDSGADHCTFPLSFTKTLGLDSAKMPMNTAGGFGGVSQPTFFESVKIEVVWPGVPPFSFTTAAGFSPGMDALGVGLLGQVGFFETFKVHFDHKTKLFQIEVP